MHISAKKRELAEFCLSVTNFLIVNKQFILQLMRISVVITLIILTTFQLLLATSTSGQNMHTDRVNISMRNESLAAGLKKIEQQSLLRFYYRKSDIKMLNNLNLPAGVRTVEQTLKELLNNTFISFRQVDGSVLLERNTAQTGYEIKGRVLAVNHSPVEFATISIKKLDGKFTVQTAQTDTAGYYTLNVKEKGDYQIVFAAMGMDSLEVALNLAESKVVTIPDITLTANVTQLKQVIITGKKAFIEQKIDRTVVNVNALISNAGANALEVLEKSPGIQVDENGGITFKGKKGVMVLIDGKPSYLSGDNLANYLRSLQASSLDQIELMSNPPAKYEASGNAGLINIKTRKSTLQGFNGNFSANIGQAKYFRTSENLNLNYHQNKVNLFSTIGYNLQNNYRKMNTQRNYLDANGNVGSTYIQEAVFKPVTHNPNLKLGMDYTVNATTTLGFVFTGSLSSGDNHNTSNSTIGGVNGAIDSLILADNQTKSKFNTGGINLNYAHRLDQQGREIGVSLDYVKYHSNKDQSFVNNTYNAAGNFAENLTISDDLPAAINIYAVKADYTHPLADKSKIEAGLKSSYVNTDNAANYFNVVNGVSMVDYKATNQFLYQENINAAYLSWTKNYNRFSVKAGLRAENTNLKGNQLGNALKPDSSFVQHYANLFPTAYFSYKLDTTGNHLLNFSYGRRIDRPFYQDLNPFLTFIDKYGYWSGNPYLKPQTSSNYELAYHYKNTFSVSLQYNLITDYQVETVQKEGDLFISRKLNLGKNPYYGINADATFDPASWWNVHVYIELTNNVTKGALYNTYLNTGQVYFFSTIQNQFDLGKGWSAEISGFYISPKIDGQYTHIATGQLNTGLQKKVLDNKGSIRVSIKDLLRTNFSGGNILSIPGATATWRNDWANRMATLGFSYNFGSSPKKSNQPDKGSAASEQNRVRN